MREIKFRVWCKDNKEWEKDLVVINPNGGLLHWFAGQFRHLGMNGHEVNLFTGLHDKNGKEIYEGDILKFSQFGEAWEVIFEKGCFCIKSECGIDYLKAINQGYAVIGNIYENPELLEV